MELLKQNLVPGEPAYSSTLHTYIAFRANNYILIYMHLNGDGLYCQSINTVPYSDPMPGSQRPDFELILMLLS